MTFRHLAVPSVLLLSATCVTLALAQRIRTAGGVNAVVTAELPPLTASAEKLTLGPKVHEVGGVASRFDDEFDRKNPYLSAVLMSNGGLMVIDHNRIRLYDREWRQVRLIGSEGDGPHEFRNLYSICRTRGDTVVVFDDVNLQVGILSADGTIVRQFKTGVPRGTVGAGACFDDGTFLIGANELSSSTGARHMQEVSRMDTRGNVVNVLGRFPAGHFNFHAMSVVLLASGQSFWVGDSDERTFRRYSIDGKPEAVYTMGNVPSPGALAGGPRVEPLSVPLVQPSVRRATAVGPSPITVPDKIPAFARVLYDGDGSLWTQTLRVQGVSYDEWIVYDLKANRARTMRFQADKVVGGQPIPLAVEHNQLLYTRGDAKGYAFIALGLVQNH